MVHGFFCTTQRSFLKTGFLPTADQSSFARHEEQIWHFLASKSFSGFFAASIWDDDLCSLSKSVRACAYTLSVWARHADHERGLPHQLDDNLARFCRRFDTHLAKCQACEMRKGRFIFASYDESELIVLAMLSSRLWFSIDTSCLLSDSALYIQTEASFGPGQCNPAQSLDCLRQHHRFYLFCCMSAQSIISLVIALVSPPKKSFLCMQAHFQGCLLDYLSHMLDCSL